MQERGIGRHAGTIRVSIARRQCPLQCPGTMTTRRWSLATLADLMSQNQLIASATPSRRAERHQQRRSEERGETDRREPDARNHLDRDDMPPRRRVKNWLPDSDNLDNHVLFVSLVGRVASLRPSRPVRAAVLLHRQPLRLRAVSAHLEIPLHRRPRRPRRGAASRRARQLHNAHAES